MTAVSAIRAPEISIRTPPVKSFEPQTPPVLSQRPFDGLLNPFFEVWCRGISQLLLCLVYTVRVREARILNLLTAKLAGALLSFSENPVNPFEHACHD